MATEKQSPMKVMDVVNSMKVGFSFMFTQGPLLNMFNNWVSIAAKNNVSTRKAIYMNYQGVEGAPVNRCTNILRSLKAHYAKEGARNFYRAIVLSDIDPILQRNLSKTQAAIAFAAILAGCEMAFANPADSLRVQRQGGGKVSYSPRSLYSGMWGNGARQFGTWGIFKVIAIGCNEHFHTIGIDPHSNVGLVAKSITTGFALNVIYPLEYIKMQLQHQQTQQQQPAKAMVIGQSPNFWKRERVYFNVARRTLLEHGWKGFFFGAFPKTLYNSFLALSAFYLNERVTSKKYENNNDEATFHEYTSTPGK